MARIHVILVIFSLHKKYDIKNEEVNVLTPLTFFNVLAGGFIPEAHKTIYEVS